jgi:hypothetical protein
MSARIQWWELEERATCLNPLACIRKYVSDLVFQRAVRGTQDLIGSVYRSGIRFFVRYVQCVFES